MKSNEASTRYCPQARPLYINEVQAWFERMLVDQTTPVELNLQLDDQGLCKSISFRVPFEDLEVDGHAHVVAKYLMARINNLLVTFGGVRLTVCLDTRHQQLVSQIEHVLAQFDLANPGNNRKGSGSFINYINRMNEVAGYPAFQAEIQPASQHQPSQAARLYQLPVIMDQPASGSSGQANLIDAATLLTGKIYCGMDIGGNAIKAAAVIDGQVFLLKTYPWNPSSLTEAEQLLHPIILIPRLFAAIIRYWQMNNHRPPEGSQAVLAEAATCEQMLAFTQHVEQELFVRFGQEGTAEADRKRVFSGITIGFPDIIVNNQIAGGETYKQRGIRQHHPDTYENEMAKMQSLSSLLGEFLQHDGVFRMVNDGNLASFVFSVEQAFSKETCIGATGMFNFTIGTEMGTGYISRDGSILDFPLECYNYIIDLGNEAAGQYQSNDIRSINNFNTGIAGTIQKYISQTGLIRMACQNFDRERRDRLDDLVARGYLSYDSDRDEFLIVTQPMDQRGSLTRQLIGWLQESDEAVQSAYQEIGYCLGVVVDEVRLLLPDLVPDKFVSGGLVHDDQCFQALVDGLSRYNPAYTIRRLEMDHLESPLLKNLTSTQANYAMALGSAYLGNLEWIKTHDQV